MDDDKHYNLQIDSSHKILQVGAIIYFSPVESFIRLQYGSIKQHIERKLHHTDIKLLNFYPENWDDFQRKQWTKQKPSFKL